MSRKEKVVFDDEKRKKKDRDFEIAVKKVSKYMHYKSPTT